MNESENIKLILKYLSGTINQEERTVLTKWVNSDPENKKTLTLFEHIWSLKEKGEKVNMQAAWNTLAKKAGIALPFEDISIRTAPVSTKKDKRDTHNRYLFLRYAAVFLIALSLVFLFKEKTKTSQVPPNQVQVIVQYGKQDKITLPDGSKVILDAGSMIRFPKKFNSDGREVILKGEAYFEVTHNSGKPFVIYANKGVITVLGTKFNVRAWEFENEKVNVVVAEGMVSLRSIESDNDKGVIIKKGEMSYLSNTHLTPVKPEKVKLEAHLAWMKRDLILDSTPLNEVLDRLARWYNLKFVLPSPVYEQVKITGTFRKKSIDHILEAIGLMIHLTYKREKNVIIFKQIN